MSKSDTSNKNMTKTLKSGKKVKLIDAKGKHYVEAKRLIGDEILTFEVALASVLVRVVNDAGEEQRVIMEDFVEWPLADFTEVIGMVAQTFLSNPEA